MLGTQRVGGARVAVLALAVVAAALGGCNRSAIPGLTTPDYALSTPAPFPPPPPLAITPGPPGAPGVPANPYGVYRLDSGDRLRVIVFGQDNLSRVYSVDTSGNLSMPLIGSVRARGLSTVQLGLDIEAELRRKSIKDPKVSVEVDTYRPFFIRRGQYPYVNAMTVEGAVATAEVYTERAKKRSAAYPQFGGLMSTVMLPSDYPVQPGDTIYVLERFF